MSTAHLTTSIGNVPLIGFREERSCPRRLTAEVNLRHELGRELLHSACRGALWGRALLFVVQPNAYTRRTRTGTWCVHGAGPSKRYSTKRLAQAAADRRGHVQSQSRPVVIERFDVHERDDGGGVLRLTLLDPEWLPEVVSGDGMVA